MDSCNVMRGSKSGLETRIRNERANHLLDIDGDSCHHIHNASKQLCKPFQNYIEDFHTNIYNDFKWSADLREVLSEICLILNIKYTMPDNMIPHRWLSCYDVTVSNKRLVDAYTVFYYAFLSPSMKVTYQRIVVLIYHKRNVSDQGKDRLRELQHNLSKKKLTEAGTKRKAVVACKLFKNRRYTRLLISFYVSVLPILKRYVMLYENQESTPCMKSKNNCCLNFLLVL